MTSQLPPVPDLSLQDAPTQEEAPAPVQTKTNDKEYFTTLIKKQFGNDADIMIRVAKCESQMRQYEDDGSDVLHGIAVKEDRGLFQINETYHLEEAKKLGIDIYTPEGNIQMASTLFRKSGLNPWSASFYCWSKHY